VSGVHHRNKEMNTIGKEISSEDRDIDSILRDTKDVLRETLEWIKGKRQIAESTAYLVDNKKHLSNDLYNFIRQLDTRQHNQVNQVNSRSIGYKSPKDTIHDFTIKSQKKRNDVRNKAAVGFSESNEVRDVLYKKLHEISDKLRLDNNHPKLDANRLFSRRRDTVYHRKAQTIERRIASLLDHLAFYQEDSDITNNNNTKQQLLDLIRKVLDTPYQSSNVKN